MCILSFQLQTEVQRLEVLKMQSMKSVIEAIRTEIALLWERCFYSQEQQQAFGPYHAGEYLLHNNKALTLNICRYSSQTARVSQGMFSFPRWFHWRPSQPARGWGQNPEEVLWGPQRIIWGSHKVAGQLDLVLGAWCKYHREFRGEAFETNVLNFSLW